MRGAPDVQRRRSGLGWAAIVVSSVMLVTSGLVAGGLTLAAPVAHADPVPPTAYITNQGSGTVSPINTATNTVGAPIAVGNSPVAIAISPDGTKAYVVNGADNTVTPIDTALGTAGTAIPVGSGPDAVAFSPDGTTVYVTNQGSNAVSPIDVATNVPATAISVGFLPSGVAFSPDGTTAYVTNNGDDSVTPIDVAARTAGPTIAVGASPNNLAISPDGAKVFVVNTGDGTVTPIDAATNLAGVAIAVGSVPLGIAFSPDGGTAYVANNNGDSVTPIDVADEIAGPPIAVGLQPTGVAFSPDGITAYVTNAGNNTVSSINVASNTVTSTILVGSAPWGIGFVPDQAPVAAFSTIGTLAAGSSVTFDASASTVAYGTVASYAWNFGDGTTGTGATTSHVYAYGAVYNPSVTETSSGGTSTTQVFTGQTMSRNGGPSATIAHSLNIAGAEPLAYITNDNLGTVTPINTASDTAGAPIAVGNSPEAIAFTPDGTKAYVVNSADNTVTPINVATGTAGAPIPVGQGPISVAFSPDGTLAYVVNNTTSTVTPITVATNSPGTEIPVGSAPYSVAFTPDGTKAYVTNFGADSVTRIDVATNTAGTEIPVGSFPIRIAISPDGSVAYVVNASSGSVTPIDLATSLPGAEIPVGGFPFGVAFSPDGTKAYVTNNASSSVTPINVSTGIPGTDIPAGPGPAEVAFSPDGTKAYVTNNTTNAVTPIDVVSDTPGTPIAVGTRPYAVAFVPDQAPVASFTTSGSHTPGSTITFDASGSHVAYGLIANYAWDFGDGSTVVNTNVPAISHVYALAGSFTARVTETSSAGTSTTKVFTGQTMSRNGGPSATTTSVVAIASIPTPPNPPNPNPPTSDISLELDAGQPVADATIVVSGDGLKPFSPVRVELHSAVVVLGSDTTDVDGAFEMTVHMPHVVSPGIHHLVVVGVQPDNTAFGAEEQFFVDWSGSLGDVQASGGYTPVAATRILDTRDGQSMTAQTELRLAVPSSQVPVDVSSLVLNVTVTDAAVGGYLTIYPCGVARPLSAAINFTAGDTKANLVDAIFRSGGMLCLWSNVDIDAIVDLQGFHSTSGVGHLVPRTAVRVVDTRPDHPLAAEQVLQVPVIGDGRAASGTSTVALNVAVVDPDNAGFLTLYPCGTDRHVTSNLNFVSGQTASNEVMVQPGTDGMVCVYTTATTQLVIDLDATFEAAGPNHFSALVPGRFADTRTTSKVLADQAMMWTVVGDDSAPMGTNALSLNVAVSDPDGAGFLTVYPCDTARPLASNLNYVAGQTTSNHVTASLGSSGQLCVYASRTTDVVIDVEGIYSTPLG